MAFLGCPGSPLVPGRRGWRYGLPTRVIPTSAPSQAARARVGPVGAVATHGIPLVCSFPHGTGACGPVGAVATHDIPLVQPTLLLPARLLSGRHGRVWRPGPPR